MRDEPNNSAHPEIKLQTELIKEIKLPTAVLAVDASPDGNKLFAACFDGGVYEVVIDTATFRLLAKHNSYASGACYLRKTGIVLSAGYDGMLRWHSIAESKEARTVRAHRFWSWQMDVSPDERFAATVTGQYLAGGYKYEPAPEQEPSVKVFDTNTGEMVWAFSHGPPVLSVAFSPDNNFLAAANMMGEIRVWDLKEGKLKASWTTPDFTSWGIIKSHHYIGGIFNLAFSPDSRELLACGMGPMTDPMAGNGKQTWQRFVWGEEPPRKKNQIKEGDQGNGLMESIQFHPSQPLFLMAGRLAQGKWNAAFFESDSGQLVRSLDAKMRVSDTLFLDNGSKFVLAGATSQERKKDGKYPEFGRLKLYRCQT